MFPENILLEKKWFSYLFCGIWLVRRKCIVPKTFRYNLGKYQNTGSENTIIESWVSSPSFSWDQESWSGSQVVECRVRVGVRSWVLGLNWVRELCPDFDSTRDPIPDPDSVIRIETPTYDPATTRDPTLNQDLTLTPLYQKLGPAGEVERKFWKCFSLCRESHFS